MARLQADQDAVMRSALRDPAVRDRYVALVCSRTMASGCRPWMGAVGGRGHGRFWLGKDRNGLDVVTGAHRYGYGIVHGADALFSVEVVRHLCDEPICQTPAHLIAGTIAENSHDWLTRRDTPRSPLRDTRGSGGRSRALRDAARHGGDLDAVADAGLAWGDRHQHTLF